MNLFYICRWCGDRYPAQHLALACQCPKPRPRQGYNYSHNGNVIAHLSRVRHQAYRAEHRQTRFMLAAVTILWALIALVAASYLPGALSTVALLVCAVCYIARLVKVGRSHRERVNWLEWQVG